MTVGVRMHRILSRLWTRPAAIYPSLSRLWPQPVSTHQACHSTTHLGIQRSSSDGPCASGAGFLSPASRGALLTAMLVMYLLLALGAGFASVWLWGLIQRSYDGWCGTCRVLPPTSDTPVLPPVAWLQYSHQYQLGSFNRDMLGGWPSAPNPLIAVSSNDLHLLRGCIKGTRCVHV